MSAPVSMCFGALVLSFVIFLQGCNHPSKPESTVAKYIGAQCNVLTGDSCNPVQLPLYAGEDYNPLGLFNVTDEEVKTDYIEHRDEGTRVTFSQSVSDISTRDAWDFGLSGPLPQLGRIFSAGAKYRSLAQQMSAHSSSNYYAESSSRYIVYTKHLSQDAGARLAESFRNAVTWFCLP